MVPWKPDSRNPMVSLGFHHFGLMTLKEAAESGWSNLSSRWRDFRDTIKNRQ